MITIIIPAYNEEKSIGGLIAKIKSQNPAYEILIIDDASGDSTAKAAQEAGARVLSHPYNKGNGASIKTGIREAGGDVLVMMDADGQHNPEDIPSLIKEIGRYDMVVGARGRGSQNLCRGIANKIYNVLASYLSGVKIPDLTSGFRAIKKDIARKFVYLLPNRFSYPTTITLSLIKAGYNVKYIPINAEKRIGKSKINLLKDGARFFIIIFKIATLFKPIKIFLPVSAVLILLGAGYYIYTFILFHRFTNMSLLLLISGANVFLLGLIAEQIAQLRFDRTEED